MWDASRHEQAALEDYETLGEAALAYASAAEETAQEAETDRWAVEQFLLHVAELQRSLDLNAGAEWLWGRASSRVAEARETIADMEAYSDSVEKSLRDVQTYYSVTGALLLRAEEAWREEPSAYGELSLEDAEAAHERAQQALDEAEEALEEALLYVESAKELLDDMEEALEEGWGIDDE